MVPLAVDVDLTLSSDLEDSPVGSAASASDNMSVDVGSDSDSDSGSFYYLGAGGESKEEFIHNCKEMEEQAPVLRSLTVEGIKSGVLESCIAHFVEALTKCTGLQELR